MGDSYRKLRNTFRYMLGGLSDFTQAERVAPADMPELERYVLHMLTELDAKLHVAVDDFDYNSYVRLLSEFVNEDLSSFFFDIRKDCLYCDAQADPKRMAYRSAMDIIFNALVRYAAPVLVFTAEEIWQSRYPDADSVHLLEWPEVESAWADEALAQKWQILREARDKVNEAIEPLRREKIVRSSLEANVVYPLADLPTDAESFAEICITADIADGAKLSVSRTEHSKCGRCWRLLPDVDEDGALCGRCDSVLSKES